jgi:hypothetical protein
MKRPDQQAIILSMARCFVGKAIYCSSELTTGLRLYSAVCEHGCKDRYELKDKLGNEWLQNNIFQPNAAAANALAATIQKQRGRATISPACLFVPEWGQHDYLTFWESIITNQISEVWFNSAWEYSNGCTFEYMAAVKAKLPTLDVEGNPLEIEEAVQMMGQAIALLDKKYIDTSKLREHRAGLRQLTVR